MKLDDIITLDDFKEFVIDVHEWNKDNENWCKRHDYNHIDKESNIENFVEWYSNNGKIIEQ